MNKQGHLFLVITILLATISCGQKKRSTTQPTPTYYATSDTTVQLSLEELPFLNPADSLPEYRLCNQVLTSEDGLSNAFDNGGGFLHESNSIDKTFYYPDKDIANDDLALQTQLFYNYVSVLNRIVHSYDWFTRMSTNESGQASMAQKRQWVKQSCPRISSSTLNRAIPDQTKRQSVKKLLAAYAAFDGEDSPGSAFYDAVVRYKEEGEEEFPSIVDVDKSDKFEEIFWPWYDKNKVVPGIDEIIKINMNDYKGEKLREEQLNGLRHSIEAEKNIDRRAILALEYVKFDQGRGVLLLGEIIESGIYSKYLLEAWISWRANVQMGHGPSSFTVIPNNYYDRLRVKCIDTMVRHCIQKNDSNAKWLLVNLIYVEIIHRMGSIAGNSSFNSVVELKDDMFIHPRLLEEK